MTILKEGPLLLDNGMVEELNLSKESSRALRRHGIRTVRTIKSLTDDDLIKIRDFGKKHLYELKVALVRYEEKRRRTRKGQTLLRY